jgi:hypothetical protein
MAGFIITETDTAPHATRRDCHRWRLPDPLKMRDPFFDAPGYHHIGLSRRDNGTGETDGLLRRSALRVNTDLRYGLGSVRCQRGSIDDTGLFRDVANGAPNHVADGYGLKADPVAHYRQHLGTEVGGMNREQAPAALTSGDWTVSTCSASRTNTTLQCVGWDPTEGITAPWLWR